jgi:hypothetical protein
MGVLDPPCLLRLKSSSLACFSAPSVSAFFCSTRSLLLSFLSFSFPAAISAAFF